MCRPWLLLLLVPLLEAQQAQPTHAKPKLMLVFAQNDSAAPARTMYVFEERKSDVPEEPSLELLPPHEDDQRDPKPGYSYPRPQEDDPKPGYSYPEPQQDDTKPGYNYPKPQQDDTKPGYNYPKPQQDDPKPGYNYPRPQQDNPKPGYSYPKPQQDDPKPGYSYPEPQQDDTKPGYSYPKPQQDDPKPGYSYPEPQQDDTKPGYSYPKPQQDDPKPGYSYPEPQQDDPKPGYSYPKPQQDDPKPGYSYPKPQQDDPKTGYSYPEPQQDDPKPGYNYPRPQQDDLKPGYSYPNPQQDTSGPMSTWKPMYTTLDQDYLPPKQELPLEEETRPSYGSNSSFTNAPEESVDDKPTKQDELPYSYLPPRDSYLPQKLPPPNDAPTDSYLPPKRPPPNDVPTNSYLPPKRPPPNDAPTDSYLPPKRPPPNDTPTDSYLPPKRPPPNDTPTDSYLPPKRPPLNDTPTASYLPPKRPPPNDAPTASYLPPKRPPVNDTPTASYLPPKRPPPNDVPTDSYGLPKKYPPSYTYIPLKQTPSNDVATDGYSPQTNDVPTDSYLPPEEGVTQSDSYLPPMIASPSPAYLPAASSSPVAPLESTREYHQDSQDAAKAAQPRHLAAVLRAGSADEHGIRITDMSCLRTASRARFTATITSPTFVAWPPVLEAVPGGGAAPAGCRIIADPADPHHRFLVDLSNPDLTRCGVRGCSADGEARLCSRVLMPSLPGLRLAADPVLLLQCALQPATGSLVQQARIVATQPATGRSAGVVHAGGERAQLRAHLQLFRRGSGGDFSRQMQSGAAVHLGDDLQLRAVVRRGDGWQSCRLSDVVVRRSSGSEAVQLVAADGCPNPDMKAVCPRPQAWLAGDPLVSLLALRVFMFRGMQDGDQLLLTARVVACLDRADCAVPVESCSNRVARSRRSTWNSTWNSMFEDTVSFSVRVGRTNVVSDAEAAGSEERLVFAGLGVGVGAVLLGVLALLRCRHCRRRSKQHQAAP